MKRVTSPGIVRTKMLGHLVGPWSATSASRRATWLETAPTATREVMTRSTTSGLAEMTMTMVATLAPITTTTTTTLEEAVAGATTMQPLQVETLTGEQEAAKAKHLDGERQKQQVGKCNE